MNPLQLAPMRRFLDKLTSHSRLGPDERRAILELPGQAAEIRGNVDLGSPGDGSDHACLIVGGLVGRFAQNRDGARQIVAVHIPGDLVGLHGVVAPESDAALQSLAPVTVLRVPRAALRAIARRHAAIAEAFWRECVLDAAILTQWVVNVGRRDAQSRTAHLLCELGCRYSAAGIARHSEFPMLATQTHLADMLGLTPVHVNRTLMALREEQVVTVQARKAVVHDWDRLVEIGDFDPDYLQIGEAVGEPACVAVAN